LGGVDPPQYHVRVADLTIRCPTQVGGEMPLFQPPVFQAGPVAELHMRHVIHCLVMQRAKKSLASCHLANALLANDDALLAFCFCHGFSLLLCKWIDAYRQGRHRFADAGVRARRRVLVGRALPRV